MNTAPPNCIRVVHFIERMAVGGMEKHIEHLLGKLPAGRFEQWLCCLNDAGPRGEQMRREGFRIVALGAKYYYVPWQFWRVFRYLRQRRPHVVHAHGEFAAIFGRLAAIVARVPVVVFQAQNVPAYVQARRHVIQNRLLTHWSAGIMACSADTKRYLVDVERIPADKVEVVHNCVDIDAIDTGQPQRKAVRAEFGFTPDHVVIGTVSRLAPVKGHRFLIDAMASVASVQPQARLLIVGDGSERERLQMQAKDLGLNDAVTFAGERRDVPRILAGLDVFAQPTADVEGLPLSIAEAMAARLPVVATDVGGVREALYDQDNGFLLPPKNSHALADALGKLIAGPQLRLRMGARAREVCMAEFSADLMAQRTAALYTKWLCRHHSP